MTLMRRFCFVVFFRSFYSVSSRGGGDGVARSFTPR